VEVGQNFPLSMVALRSLPVFAVEQSLRLLRYGNFDLGQRFCCVASIDFHLPNINDQVKEAVK
jgi:hypothetical protein